MAKIADKYCDSIILTNEDPYDEDPMKIINDMAVVIPKDKLFVEIERREAIKMAIGMADEKSVVIITGKGTDPYIMVKNGQKIPWDDKTVVEEELSKI
jgi:UDP-N-acetylmuramoyl-L-alanyl-D-glutamate--2,6-diaminopimelate ligase